MGWLSDFGSSICSGFSKLGSFISGCASRVGSALKNFGTKVMEVGTKIFETCVNVGKTLLENSAFLSKACAVVGMVLAVVYPPLGIPLNRILSVASRAFMILARAYDLFNPDESMEEIGEKVLEATEQGIVPENYANWEEYREAIRNTETSGNPDKYTREEKLVAFMSVTELGLYWKERLDPATIEMLLRFEDFFTQDRLHAYRQEAAKSNFDFNNVSVYFTGQGTCEEMQRAWNFMRKAEKGWNHEFDEKRFYTQILDIKNSIAEKEEKTRNETR